MVDYYESLNSLWEPVSKVYEEEIRTLFKSNFTFYIVHY